jgi:hypothetical protein
MVPAAQTHPIAGSTNRGLIGNDRYRIAEVRLRATDEGREQHADGTRKLYEEGASATAAVPLPTRPMSPGNRRIL